MVEILDMEQQLYLLSLDITIHQLGSAVVLNLGLKSKNIATTYDSTNNKVVITYTDYGNNYGTAIVGTVSGTSISFGSETVFNSGTAGSYYIAVYDPTKK